MIDGIDNDIASIEISAPKDSLLVTRSQGRSQVHIVIVVLPDFPVCIVRGIAKGSLALAHQQIGGEGKGLAPQIGPVARGDQDHILATGLGSLHEGQILLPIVHIEIVGLPPAHRKALLHGTVQVLQIRKPDRIVGPGDNIPD